MFAGLVRLFFLFFFINFTITKRLKVRTTGLKSPKLSPTYTITFIYNIIPQIQIIQKKNGICIPRDNEMFYGISLT